MTIEAKRYRAHQEITAVRLTEDNLADVAEWCSGSVTEDDDGPFGISLEGTWAGIGDWVVEGDYEFAFEVLDDDEFRFYDFQEIN